VANKERIQLLVDALKSGEFTQGKGYLAQIEDGELVHCCLGVACVVAQRNGLDLSSELNASGLIIFDEDNDTELPLSVSEWYGFDASPHRFNPVVGHNEFTDEITATNANDDLNWNFEKIAEGFKKTYIGVEEAPNTEKSIR